MAVSQNNTITADDFNKWTVQFSTYTQKLSKLISTAEQDSDDDENSTFPTTTLSSATLGSGQAATYEITRSVPSGYTETGIIYSINTGSSTVVIRRLTMSKICFVNAGSSTATISNFTMVRRCHRAGIYLSTSAGRVSSGTAIKAAHINGLGIDFTRSSVSVGFTGVSPKTGKEASASINCPSGYSFLGIAGFTSGNKQLSLYKIAPSVSTNGQTVSCTVGVTNIDQRSKASAVDGTATVMFIFYKITFNATTAYRTRVSTTDTDPKIRPTALNNIQLHIVRTTQTVQSYQYGPNKGYELAISSGIKTYNAGTAADYNKSTSLLAMYGYNSHYKWLIPRYIQPYHSTPRVFFTNASTGTTITKDISICQVYYYLS